MDFKREENRIFLTDSQGATIAEVLIPENEPGIREIKRTFVDDSLQGQGIADQLLQEVVRQLMEENKRGLATCSYAVKWFDKHQEYRYLLKK